MVEYKIYIAPPPEELYLRFPFGQSVNKDFIIQIEGDSTLSGGVIPDLRVPLNDTVINQLYTDSIDVELKYAIGKLNSMLGINENQPGGSGLELDPVIPNPVRSMASITYRLQEPAEVTLALYDICGKQIKTLVAERQKSGSHTVTWSSEGIYPGLYLYHLTAGGVSQTRKFIVQ
jgi:hypothetical protein